MWEIIGYELKLNADGELVSVTLYGRKPLQAPGAAGYKVCREWYRATEVDYRPALGDQVVICKEDFGKFSVITEILKM